MNSSKNSLNGGEVLVETLLARGVDTVFFVPGGTFVTVLEALSRRQEAIRALPTRLESSAMFAAEAYATIRNRPACVIVSRAPGATNAAIGVHTAMQGSRPVVLVVANIPRALKQREAFQEVDYALMYAPIAKAVFDLSSFDEVASVTARALELSVSGRPGPVVITVSKDILDGRTGELNLVKQSAPVVMGPAPNAINEAARLVKKAKRPLVVAGEMVSFERCHEPLASFVEHIGAPVMCAFRQQDVIANDHPGYAGHLSLNRPPYQSQALDESDLIIAIGTRLDSVTSADYTMPEASKRLIMIYPEPSVFSQWQAEVALASHCGPALTALQSAIESDPPAERVAWRDRLHAEELAFVTPGEIEVEGDVDLARVVETFQSAVPSDSIIVSDAGTFSRWLQRHYRFNLPATTLGPVSGAMGYGVPAGLGAAVADPNRPVFTWVGDGGFLMTGHELAAIVQEKLPVKIIVCDNAAWGSILVHQHKRFPGWDFGTRLQSPDFAALGEGYGVPAFAVPRTADFLPALKRAMTEEGPALIHLQLDPRDVSPYSGNVR